jgi:hypothetical protein
MAMDTPEKRPAPPMKLAKMSRFGFAAASRIWGREKALEMFHQRRASTEGTILAVAPDDRGDGR